MTQVHLQGRVNGLFARLSCPQHLVVVEIVDGSEIPATATGARVWGMPIGNIRLARTLLGILTDNEVEFVLAHEVAHIYLNHLVTKASLALTRALVENASREEPAWKMVLLGWDVFKLLTYGKGELPLAAAVTKDQEFEADAWAVLLTRNKAAAHGALRSLVGGNLDSPSHTWEVFDVPLPAMSVRERLAALDARYP